MCNHHVWAMRVGRNWMKIFTENRPILLNLVYIVQENWLFLSEFSQYRASPNFLKDKCIKLYGKYFY